MRNWIAILLLSMIPCISMGQNQTYCQYKTDEATLVFFDKNLSRYIPHMIRMYQNGKALHEQIWTSDSIYQPEAPLLLLTDWEDDGNGGASPLPRSLIQIGMAPLNMSYYINPSSERYSQLFKHEYTHIVMTDKYNHSDRNWRRFFGTKVDTDNKQPISALWSYLSVPRWYSPRWYHEGIACFMETWLSGGVGRALGGYDEMYFRSIINEGDKLYSVVGLETEGSTKDFQVGANAYLYGTRFVNYLTKTYGYEKMIQFYNRTADSRTFFGKQFKKVYGQSLRKVWNDWKEDEKKHQESPFVYDPVTQKAYAAMNAPGDFAHMTEIDLQTGEQKRLNDIYGIQLYDPAYVALDRKGQRLIYTTNNSKMRGLEIYDIQQKKVVKKKKYQRIGNIVYDNTHDCLYGLFSNGGTQSIVRMDRDLENPEVIYAFPFGVSVFDSDISHDGKWLSFTSQGDNGEHTLLLFNTEELAQAIFKPVKLITWNDSNLGQFRFSLDDKYLIGSSYYTGVSNLWQINLETREMEMLTNTDIGLFAPLEITPGQLLALQFKRDGLQPVLLAREVVKDANAVTLYGQLAYENNKEAMEQVGLLRDSLPRMEFSDVYNNITSYNVFKEMKFAGAYPIISGFTDSKAWNHMTPVIGYRFNVNDPVGLSSMKLSVGLSPWSNNDWKNKFHIDFDWKYYFWTLKAAWNHMDFYDLFGPTRKSRKGFVLQLAYDYSNTLVTPYDNSWGFSVATYGHMDALPLYQEVEVQGVRSMQTASIYRKWSKTRTSLGGVMKEQGYQLGIEGYGYLAGGRFYPSIEASGDFGTLLPIDRNTSFWLRTAAGHNFGDEESVFGTTYFGGFRNNYVDNRNAFQYRTTLAMPGTDIDAIPAHTFAKATAELNLRPIRLNDFGALFCYPTWIQCSLFGTGLSTWIPNSTHKMYYSTGIQLTTELVFLNYLKTTLSLGYGHLFAPEGFQNGRHGNEFMISLKLL
ncbi:hypothetical protein [uncultured Prevotella sp.]|uniref:hypothetical protein n=1 Tax=uncultured Prevotella sp. TaxID=159272 RepID=UPI00258C5543|nr:hypothetical protein [uncultured Prevotella sp.]